MLATGDVFAGYAIERQLGRGGMGSVYLARHPRLPRQTALKLLNPELFADNEIRARFVREADLAARLEHPNIVTVYDRGIDDGRLWISMQFVDGVDAATIEHPVAAERALRIIEGTAAALDHAHRNGVLHRDVKPANILLADVDGKERVLLTDFGIARPRDDVHHLTQTGSFTATLAYAAPEQLTGAHLDHRADQYALACTLYSLLTGVSPFDATNPVMVIQGHLQTPPPSLHVRRPDLPAALDAVLARALAKRATDRFDSCAEFAAAARRALSETGAQPTVFARHSMPRVPQQSHLARHPQASHAAVPQQYSGYARPPFAMPAQPNPGHPMPVRRRSRMPIVLLLVLASVLGAGYWVWQDKQSALADFLQRSQGHQDLNALHDAFPQMTPAGYSHGRGFGGRNCSATVKPLGYGDPWTKTFDGYEARRTCSDQKMVDTHYAFYTYPTAEAAAAVVARFRQETKDHGQSSTGTRTDDRREQSANGQYNGSAIISTFSEPARARWVLLFYRGSGSTPFPGHTVETNMPILVADVASFPLG
ncbi:serine/threonine-protein kinase [Nocardia sp. XZ_19_231]|uniref:serine/threonine-protein kinase n=1 Tax=Nocardia sp. XZ_19_231 TaxID=2769252 RepID=UPI00188EE427|nr:serine/threonine-protein kinase [Nocardia sp. XZ_19_231]